MSNQDKGGPEVSNQDERGPEVSNQDEVRPELTHNELQPSPPPTPTCGAAANLGWPTWLTNQGQSCPPPPVPALSRPFPPLKTHEFGSTAMFLSPEDVTVTQSDAVGHLGSAF